MCVCVCAAAKLLDTATAAVPVFPVSVSKQAMAARSRPPDGPRQRRGLLSSHSLWPPLFGAGRAPLSLSLSLSLVPSLSPSFSTREVSLEPVYSVARGICAVRQPRNQPPFRPSTLDRGLAIRGLGGALPVDGGAREAGGEAASGGGGTGCGGAVASERRSAVGTLDRAIPPSQQWKLNAAAAAAAAVSDGETTHTESTTPSVATLSHPPLPFLPRFIDRANCISFFFLFPSLSLFLSLYIYVYISFSLSLSCLKRICLVCRNEDALVNRAKSNRTRSD